MDKMQVNKSSLAEVNKKKAFVRHKNKLKTTDLKSVNYNKTSFYKEN